ncbi:hypothetical protein D3C84_1319970 [compost metagenome]
MNIRAIIDAIIIGGQRRYVLNFLIMKSFDFIVEYTDGVIELPYYIENRQSRVKR